MKNKGPKNTKNDDSGGRHLERTKQQLETSIIIETKI